MIDIHEYSDGERERGGGEATVHSCNVGGRSYNSRILLLESVSSSGKMDLQSCAMEAQIQLLGRYISES